MNRTSLFFILSLCLSSCLKILDERHPIFLKKVGVKTYYQFDKVIAFVPDGIIYGFQKNSIYEDTTKKCDLFSKQEYIVSKVDFEGREMWQVMRDNIRQEIIDHPNGSFYSIYWKWGDYKFKKYSNQFLLEDDFCLNLAKHVKGVLVEKINILPNGNFLLSGYGLTVSKQVEGEKIYQPFFCEISQSGALEKMVTDPNTYTSNQANTGFAYSKIGNGNIVGVRHDYEYTKTTLNIYIRVYDKNYKVLKTEQRTYAKELNSNVNMVQYDNDIHMLIPISDGTKIITINESGVSEKEIAENLKVLPIKSDKGIYFEKGQEIIEFLPGFTLRQVAKIPPNIFSYEDFFWNTEKRKLLGIISRHGRSDISFVEQLGDNLTLKKLYKSDSIVHRPDCFGYD